MCVLDAVRQTLEWLTQPLGFKSLALRVHSTTAIPLDNPIPAAMIDIDGQRPVPSFLSPD